MKKMRLLFLLLLSIFDLSKSICAADFDPEELRRALEISLAEFQAIQDDDPALKEDIKLSLLNDNHKEMTEKKVFQASNEHFTQNKINSLCALQGQKVDIDEKSEADQKKIVTRLFLDQLLENSYFIKEIADFLGQVKKDHEALYKIQDIKDNISSYERMLTYPDGYNVSNAQAMLDQEEKLLAERKKQAGKPDYAHVIREQFVYTDNQKQEYRFDEKEVQEIMDNIL